MYYNWLKINKKQKQTIFLKCYSMYTKYRTYKKTKKISTYIIYCDGYLSNPISEGFVVDLL